MSDHTDLEAVTRHEYTQPGKLFRLMTPEEQQRLFGKIARYMAPMPRAIQFREMPQGTHIAPPQPELAVV